MTRWHFLAVPVVTGSICSNISCITFRADLSSINLERLWPLSPGLSVPLSIPVLNYWQVTRTGKVCLPGYTLEQPMLLKCCGSAAWPGPCGYCVRKHTSHFLGAHFWVWHMDINFFPTQYLVGCRGFQASFASYPRFKKINNCHHWFLFFANSSLSEKY